MVATAPHIEGPRRRAPRDTLEDERPACLQGRVLVADDDDNVRRTIRRALTHAGFEVIEACNGIEALNATQRVTPDLAIVDVHMPRMGGLEVVKALKTAHAARLPVLVLSGMDEPEDRMNAFDAGADDFVAKPVFVPELLRRVEAFERTRRAYIDLQIANEKADNLRLFAAEAAALLAHDLNNGLSVALANMQFVAEVSVADGEELEALQATSRALRRMAGLVRNFVDIARLEDAAIKPARIQTDVNDLLSLAAAVHDTGASQHEVTVEVSCSEGTTAFIDPVLVERVIHNLLGNAMRYVNDGGRVRLRAELIDSSTLDEDSQLLVEGSQLLVEIANTGAIIPEDKRSSLFEKYVTGMDHGSKRGMGLYFCRLAAEAHGGSISLESDGIFATRFIVRLPH